MSITINRYIKWLVAKLPLRGIIACTNERLNFTFYERRGARIA